MEQLFMDLPSARATHNYDRISDSQSPNICNHHEKLRQEDGVEQCLYNSLLPALSSSTHLSSSPTIVSDVQGFSSQSSESEKSNDNHLLNGNDYFGLPSLIDTMTADRMTLSDSANLDHSSLLDFVMRLTETPPDHPSIVKNCYQSTVNRQIGSIQQNSIFSTTTTATSEMVEQKTESNKMILSLLDTSPNNLSTSVSTPTWSQDSTNNASPIQSSGMNQLFNNNEYLQYHHNLIDNNVYSSRSIPQSDTDNQKLTSFESLKLKNSGLRHLHTDNRFIKSTAGGYNEDYSRSQHNSNSPSNQYNNINGNYDWEQHNIQDLKRNTISKGLSDFHSLAYASKRWQNLNVVLPLYIPHGVIAVVRSTGENTYVFSDQYPSSQLLFSGTARVCDMWATYLRLRVAVIHKCPEFLVPRVAQVFNHVLNETLPKFSDPIHLRCAGIVKHTIQLRSSGGMTFRYDTIGQISNTEDQDKMRIIFDGLQRVMAEVNDYLVKEVEEVFRSVQGRDGFQDDMNTVASLRCGLEFRFSPCKELKIAIREGTMCDCAGVDSVIAGGGASSMSTWAQQFIVENLIVGEVRLERDKTSETQLDPFFLPQSEIKTRMISKDLDGKPARICFVDPAVYPDFCRPRVEYTVGLNPLQAAESLVGATHQQLAKLLPNGMSSLTAISSASLISPMHRPGIGLLQPSHNMTPVSIASSGSSSTRVAPFNERLVATTGCLPFPSGRPFSFSQPISSTPYSGALESSVLCESDHVNDSRQDFYSYSRQQQQQRHTGSNRETPTTNGTTNDALKGLAVLQKMLADLDLHSTQISEDPDETNSGPVSSANRSRCNSQVESVHQQPSLGLGLHRDSQLKGTPEAVLLSQLHSALQKLPYIANRTPGSETSGRQQNDITKAIFESPKQEDRQQEQQLRHLPFPNAFNAMPGLFDESEGMGPNLDDRDLGLLRGSKSVGATPLNYSTIAAVGASPTTTISSASFIHVGCVAGGVTDLSPSSTTDLITKSRNVNNSGASSTVPSSLEDVKDKHVHHGANEFDSSREEF